MALRLIKQKYTITSRLFSMKATSFMYKGIPVILKKIHIYSVFVLTGNFYHFGHGLHTGSVMFRGHDRP